MSNLPDDVNEYTVGAPWNEETKLASITVILSLDVEVGSDFSDDDLISEVRSELHRALINTDFDIEDIIIE